MINKIKELFRMGKPSKQEQIDVLLFEELKQTQKRLERVQEHLIAIARLSLIKPDRLRIESRNNKANGEYLLKMVEENKNEKTN